MIEIICFIKKLFCYKYSLVCSYFLVSKDVGYGYSSMGRCLCIFYQLTQTYSGSNDKISTNRLSLRFTQSLWLLYTVTFTFLGEETASLSLFSSCLKAVSFIPEGRVKPVFHPYPTPFLKGEVQPLHVNEAWQERVSQEQVMSGIPSTLAKCLQSGS